MISDGEGMKKRKCIWSVLLAVMMIFVSLPGCPVEAGTSAMGPDLRESATIALIDTGVNGGSEGLTAVSVIGKKTGDDNGHGTKMYGYIREEAPDVNVLSIKALDKNGEGKAEDIEKAIRYAIRKKVDVISLSASAKNTACNASVEKAISDADKAGIKVVCSAGNQSMNAKKFLPGCVGKALVVGACDADGGLQIGSNYGPTVDFYVNAESTSEAAARMAAFAALGMDNTSNSQVFRIKNASQQRSGEGLSSASENFTVDWDLEITKDIKDGHLLTENLGMELVTRKSILKVIKENWSKGRRYKDAKYAGAFWDAGRCVNYADKQYAGNAKAGYGYNCSGFVMSVLYYANGGTEKGALSKMESMYLPLKQGRRYLNQKSFADSSGWYSYFNGVIYPDRDSKKYIPKTNLYYLGVVQTADAIQKKLDQAEAAGKVKPGDMVYFWPTGNTDCHVGFYAGKSKKGVHQMYHAVGEGRHLGVWTPDITLSPVLPVDVSYMYIVPMPDETTVQPNSWVTTASGNKKYYNKNLKAVVGWKKINKKWYFFNSAGIMQTGWVTSKGVKYFLGSDGSLRIGWKKMGDGWCYLDDRTGALSHGWKKIKKKWYLFSPDGLMQTGWVTSKGVKYFLSADGSLRTGWKKTGGGLCYLDETTGALTIGWKKIKGKKYHFGTDGLLIP